MLINQINFINSPLEQFEVVSLLSFNAPIFGYFTLSLTNLALYSILILFLILGLHYMGNNETKLLPSKWSIALESLFSSINSMVREQIGINNEIYLPLIYTLFCFIIIANLIGNIPYSFVITSSVIISLGLSFTIFIGVTILGLTTHILKFILALIPFILFISILALEVGVSIIQAFVFCLLTCTYLRDVIELH